MQKEGSRERMKRRKKLEKLKHHGVTPYASRRDASAKPRKFKHHAVMLQEQTATTNRDELQTWEKSKNHLPHFVMAYVNQLEERQRFEKQL